MAFNKLLAKIAALKDEGDVDQAVFDEYKAKFMKAMDNDLNTSLAITALYDVIKSDADSATKLALIKDFDTVLSLNLISNAQKAQKASPAEDIELPEEVKALLEERKAARKERNFALADALRDKITALGYSVEETRQGTVVKKL